MATTDITHAYAADIVKFEDTPEGLMVYGKAAGPELDLDGQICDPEWLKVAMPQWMKWGNIREQHSAIAAGVGKELEEKSDGWWLKSLIVDDGTIKKIKAGVLKGYSIGVAHAKVVRDARAPKGRIVGGDIVEESVVDRPSNPTTVMTICKMAGGTSLQPVNAAGEPLEFDGVGLGKAATAGVPLSAALATVDGVLHGDLLKQLDEADDIDGAWDAIRQICELIKSEADGLSRGNKHEVHDIGYLMDAVRALECFIECEEREQEGAAGYDGMEADMTAYKAQLLDAGDLFKSAGDEDEDDEDEDDEDEDDEDEDDEDEDEDDEDDEHDEDDEEKAYLAKSATLVKAEIKKAVAEATGQYEAKLEALQAELAKAMAAPATGGPVLMTQPTMPHAPQASQADHYRAIAARPGISPEVAADYRALAQEVEVGAAA